MWPGFGQNMRPLKWVVERCRGRVSAAESSIGWLPRYEDIELRGLDFSEDQWNALMAFDNESIRQQTLAHEEFFLRFGDKLPEELQLERALQLSRVSPG
jgi:phosphoenolpyruvate carboxykinase (GTP)